MTSLPHYQLCYDSPLLKFPRPELYSPVHPGTQTAIRVWGPSISCPLHPSGLKYPPTQNCKLCLPFPERSIHTQGSYHTLLIHLQGLKVTSKDCKGSLATLLGRWVTLPFLPIELLFPRMDVDAELFATVATHTHTHAHACVHTYTHMYTHTHTVSWYFFRHCLISTLESKSWMWTTMGNLFLFFLQYIK